MNGNLKDKIFTIGLAVWFLTAIYLSINSMVNLFIDTDPYIARFLLIVSFINSVAMGFDNKRKSDDFFIVKKTEEELKEEKVKKKTGCSSCKKK